MSAYNVNGFPKTADRDWSFVSVSPGYPTGNAAGSHIGTTLFMPPAEAINLMAALAIAVIEAEPTAEMRARICEVLRNMLMALDEVGRA